MLLKIFIWSVILYYLYKFVFNVVVPVGKTANAIRTNVQKMQEQQQRKQEDYQQQQQRTNYTQQQKAQASNSHDYIDFEEVK